MAAEERRPAPFPGKLRPAAVGKKEKLQGEGRGCSRLAALAAPRHRTNRAFGTTRSTNVNLQKLPAVDSKSLKQPKPVVISRRLPQKDASKIELKTESTGASRDQAKDATSKPKPEAKKSVVRFQDQERPAEKNIRKSPTPEEGPLTPKSSIRPALLGTPYFSAQSCSKCRFDKLEYAPYWLTQIKLAESVGKHFASAAFFRLAFECNAEPMRSLKSELKRYLARHSSLPILAMWNEVSRDYGLLDGEPNFGLISFDSVAASVEGKQNPRSTAQQGKLELGGMPQLDLTRKPTKNSDSDTPDQTSIAEEPLHDITTVNGDGEDAAKTILIPCDETVTKEMVDNGTAIEISDQMESSKVDSSDGDRVSSADDYVIPSLEDSMKDTANDGNGVDASGHKNSLMAASTGEEVAIEKSDGCSGFSADASLTPSNEALKEMVDDGGAIDSPGHDDSLMAASPGEEVPIEKSDWCSGFSADASLTPSNEALKEMGDDGGAIDSPAHDDSLMAASPGEEVPIEKSDWCSGFSANASLTPSNEALKDTGDDRSAIDSSGHKDSMMGTSSGDKVIIEKSVSSSTSKEVRIGNSVNESTTASGISKSTSDFRGKRTGKTKDEVNKNQNVRLGKKTSGDKNINKPTNGTRNTAVLVKMR